MPQELRALVLGSGFAGKGHAEALRANGVEVAGMASRTESVVKDVTAQMGIPYASTDWSLALKELQPDIVALGTPGGAHLEPLKAALSQGAHVFCDKPMTTSAADSREIYRLARSKGVKTAFAASFRYQPHALLAKRLFEQGAIGEPREVECISHYNLNPLIPWGWSHSIALGGGRLANNFTHKLSIVEHVLDGHIVRVNGEARNDMLSAPVVDGVHDFREREKLAPGADSSDSIEWRPVDSEWSYTVMAKIDAGAAVRQPVSAVFKHGALAPRKLDDYIAFYGSEGAIFIAGAYAQGPLFSRKSRLGEWEQVPVPTDITGSIPDIENDTQRNWTQLLKEFVADIRGEGYSGYQTFRDGWRYQEVIDAIRRGDGWNDVPFDA